ncbi:MAG: VOC family protein [Chloroflexi bacterium]|nr:VOC family protein [Chloroflexota bacterium]
MITQINATVLFAKDFDACVAFYRDVIGLKVKTTDEGFTAFEMGGQELAIMNIRNAAQMVTEDAIQPQKSGAHRILLASFVEDTDKAYETLKSKGVNFIKSPTTQPWGQRTAYFQDPEGNIWEISHFLPEEK